MMQLTRTSLAILLGTLIARAEVRTFTNTDGKKLGAELMAVENDSTVLRLANDSVVKVPLKSLSAEDQSFATAWWEKNKDKIGPMDIRVLIDRNTERIERTVVRPKGGGGKQNANQITKKHTVDSFNYSCTLKNFTRKTITGLTAEYTI
jgi:hypothetical protein